ncbi:nuclear transport factor 2 family protein [Geodermatophilus sabuli]|uniref:nuclear transport factor 2 family protein n=1 Tax=Geodermatophilus sabuli TaxID=1564158 RepID=UPI0017D2CAD6|nr:nuclear transport factor 2 family protein [Geodermatophilus sabuli]MBB3086625.1 ketosteroid isomerase-like protein [Geodermatophilus sabuli]
MTAAVPSPREVAEAFSGHRFRDVYDRLAPDVRWTAVGEGELVGRQAVVDACEDTLTELSTGSAKSQRFVVIAEGDAVAVDTVTRYVDADGAVSVVSSCDVYAFTDGVVTTIRSYAVELETTTPPG